METKNLNTKYCVGLGEILFDVLPTGSQLGGAPANFAYHAGQHGLHSVAVSAVGKDVLGDTALRLLDEKKLKYVMPEVEFPTGTVQVQLDKEGVPTYDIKQNVAWDNIPFTDDIKEIAANAGAAGGVPGYGDADGLCGEPAVPGHEKHTFYAVRSV